MSDTVNPDLGSDFDCDGDLTPEMTEVAGRPCLAQHLCHRLETPRGMLWYDKNYGFDISNAVGSSTPEAVLRAGIRTECLKDERVLDAFVVLNTVETAGQLVLKPQITITDAQGSFTFVASPSDSGLRAELLAS